MGCGSSGGQAVKPKEFVPIKEEGTPTNGSAASD